MEKKKLLKNKRTLLLALSSSLIMSTPVSASRGEDIENKLDSIFGTFVDIDNAINEKIDNIFNEDTYEIAKDGVSEIKDSAHGYADSLIDYNHENLEIVTFVPNEDPNEERKYFFVNSLVPGLPKIYYLDEEGNEVNRKSDDKRFKVKVKVHHTITEDENGSKYAFEEKTYEDLVTGEVWTNTVALSKDEPYLTDASSLIEFGVFEDIADVIPADLVKDEYKLGEVKDLTEYINNLDNSLAFDEELSLTR